MSSSKGKNKKILTAELGFSNIPFFMEEGFDAQVKQWKKEAKEYFKAKEQKRKEEEDAEKKLERPTISEGYSLYSLCHGSMEEDPYASGRKFEHICF
jgi:hypothetical protein